MQWLSAFVSATLFSITDTLSTSWMKTGGIVKLVLVFVLSPLAYLCFGWTGVKMGLANTSVFINAMVVVITAAIGLGWYGEWRTTTAIQYVGMLLAVVAILCVGLGGATTPPE